MQRDQLRDYEKSEKYYLKCLELTDDKYQFANIMRLRFIIKKNWR